MPRPGVVRMVHHMQCRSAELTKLATGSVSVTANLARPTQFHRFPAPSCAAPAPHCTTRSRGGGSGRRQGRRRQSRQLAEPHQTGLCFSTRTRASSLGALPTPRACQCRGVAPRVLLVRSSVNGPLPWVRHGGENGGGIVVVRSGLVRRIHEVHA